MASVGSSTSVEPSIQTLPIQGLIPSVDPNIRRTIITRGKKDPFSLFPIDAQTQYIERRDFSSTSKKTNKILTQVPIRKNSASIDHQKAVAKAPTPMLSQSTLITGVVDMGSNNVLIVLRSPMEETSRYVRVGQYIAGGQVLVKRVVNDDTNLPTVVLEEKGQEFYKKIGQQGGSISQDNEPNQKRPAGNNILS